VAGLGFKDFTVGEVATSSDVDGYLMQQAVMRFADSGARGSALGTAVGTAAALAEGMVSYLDDVNGVQVYTGSGWVGVGSFSASTAIAATDAAWAVPSLGDPIVRVTCIGGGGGSGAAYSTGNVVGWGTNGSSGGTTSFACAAGTATAAGGPGGNAASIPGGIDATDGVWRASNYGVCGLRTDFVNDARDASQPGKGGSIAVFYLNLSGISTVNVTIGAGGAGGTSLTSTLPGANGGDGGDGLVIVEYRAA